MIPYIFTGIIFVEHVTGRTRLFLGTVFLALGAALAFTGDPLTMVGTAFIIIFAFVGRSLPASVRSGVASLQQIDSQIKGVVISASYLGDVTEYVIEVEGQELVMVENDPRHTTIHQTGESVRVGFLEDCSYVLPAQP